MKTLNKIINDLPMFDETETGKPCLEDLMKELGLKELYEEDWESMASRVFNLIASVLTMYETLKALMPLSERKDVWEYWSKEFKQAQEIINKLE